MGKGEGGEGGGAEGVQMYHDEQLPVILRVRGGGVGQEQQEKVWGEGAGKGRDMRRPGAPITSDE